MITGTSALLLSSPLLSFGVIAESQELSIKDRMSQVRDHFILKKEDNKVQCVYCKAELVYHNSRSTVIQHLNRKHPVVNRYKVM